MSQLPIVVLDASAALALVLADEEGAEVQELLLDVVERNGQIFVPALFWYELGNGLLSAARAGRIGTEAREKAVGTIGRLPVVTDMDLGEAARSRVMSLADGNELTFYDAAHLELAQRFQCRLKTCDRHLLSLKEKYPDIV